MDNRRHLSLPPRNPMILVTGGAGFIGANFVLNWLAASDESVLNLDKLTYAGNRGNLASLDGDARHGVDGFARAQLADHRGGGRRAAAQVDGVGRLVAAAGGGVVRYRFNAGRETHAAHRNRRRAGAAMVG